ncbi:MAG: GntR family transcriptional regulator [Candidatus Eisenbacteria bacterium]|nr:GntR family transcriptional regulator [Candidatus Eisenbacteria bacterium]
MNLKSLREQAYELLKERLGDGALRPGAAVHVDSMAASLGVSRTPLREALLQLAHEGFVTIHPRRGIVVSELSLDDIRHIYEIIGALESAVILGAGARLGSEEATRMRVLNEEMRAALATDDFNRYYARNLDFHDVYLVLSANAALVRIVRTLKARLYDFPRREGYVREWEMASVDEHDAIVMRIAAEDRRAAADYVRDIHWSYAVQEPFVRRYYAATRERSV